jgi:hypothetical protein
VKEYRISTESVQNDTEQVQNLYRIIVQNKNDILQNRYRMAILIQNRYRILSTEYVQNMYRMIQNHSGF